MTPADRYRTATELVDALEAAILAEPKPMRLPRHAVRSGPGGRRLAVAAITVTIVVVGRRSWVGAAAEPAAENDGAVSLVGRDIALDTSRFAILPVELEGEASAMGQTASLDIAELVREGFRRWRGITVADAFHVKDVLARRPDSVAFGDVRATRIGDARRGPLRPAAVVAERRFAASHGLAVRHARQCVTRGEIGEACEEPRWRDHHRRRSVDSLLFPVTTSDRWLHSARERGRWRRGNRTCVATSALEEWNLDLADDHFREATEVDSRFAEAFLWLAQVRSWKKDPVAEWSFAAERAAAARSQLSGRDSLMSVALVALGKREARRGLRRVVQAHHSRPIRLRGLVQPGELPCVRQPGGS